MATEFFGVYSALITPFDINGELDLQALSELIAMQKVSGMNGIVLAGTTGEASTLSLEDRIRLVRCAKESNLGDMKLIAGAGSNCTRTAIKYNQAMAEAGAHATLHVTPYYNRPTDEGLYQHYRAIAQNSPVPIIMYNNSVSRTGIEMKAHTVARLALECENIVGLKEASMASEKLNHMMSLIKPARPDFSFLSSEDSEFFSFLTQGADGAISTCSQVAGAEMKAVYQAFQQGDLVYAQKITRKLNNFYKLMFSHTNPIPIKTILASMGLTQKVWRLPLCALAPEQEKILLEECREFIFLQSLKNSKFLL